MTDFQAQRRWGKDFASVAPAQNKASYFIRPSRAESELNLAAGQIGDYLAGMPKAFTNILGLICPKAKDDVCWILRGNAERILPALLAIKRRTDFKLRLGKNHSVNTIDCESRRAGIDRHAADTYSLLRQTAGSTDRTRRFSVPSVMVCDTLRCISAYAELLRSDPDVAFMSAVVYRTEAAAFNESPIGAGAAFARLLLAHPI